MKVIVAGSRSFDDYKRLAFTLSVLFPAALTAGTLKFISGGARGADRLAERFAAEFNVPITVMLADWETHGFAAGVIRNKQMAQEGDVLVAFWDGASPGTRHMIDAALACGLEVHVYSFKDEQDGEGKERTQF